MKVSKQTFSEIVSVTDLRYRWPMILKILEKGNAPLLIVEHSSPKAVIYPFSSSLKPTDDPIFDWRKKYAKQFSDFDATKIIRKFRDKRWKLY